MSKLKEKELETIVRKGRPATKETVVEQLILQGMTSIADYDKKGRIYASSSALCPRQTTVGSITSSKEIKPASMHGYMQLGIAIEEIVTDALYKSEALLFKQYRLPDIGLNMGGYIDAIVHASGKISLLEVKSCGALPGSPKKDHLAQASVYSAVTGLPASLLYFSRNVADYNGELQMREYPLNLAYDDHLAVLWKVAYARLCIDEKVIPGIPSGWKKSHCGFCGLIPVCWGDELLPGTSISDSQSLQFMEKAKEIAKRLADPSEMQARRNGVLKHLEQHGTKQAVELLKDTDWSAL